MKIVLTVIFASIFLATVPMAAVQMRGSSGGMGQGQSGVGGMQGQHSQTGMGGTGQSRPTLTSDQRRQLMHTTQLQDKKYATCAQAMNKVRGRIGHMGSSTTSAQSAGAQQSDDGSDQLGSDVQDLEQDQNDFLDSLSEDQKTALENQVKDVQKKMKQLDALSKELKAELADKNADPKKIREEAKKLDKLSKAIQNEQRQIAVALGILS